MIVIVPSSYSQLVCTFLTTSIICDDCNFHAKEEIDKFFTKKHRCYYYHDVKYYIQMDLPQVLHKTDHPLNEPLCLGINEGNEMYGR